MDQPIEEKAQAKGLVVLPVDEFSLKKTVEDPSIDFLKEKCGNSGYHIIEKESHENLVKQAASTLEDKALEKNMVLLTLNNISNCLSQV